MSYEGKKLRELKQKDLSKFPGSVKKCFQLFRDALVKHNSKLRNKNPGNWFCEDLSPPFYKSTRDSNASDNDSEPSAGIFFSSDNRLSCKMPAKKRSDRSDSSAISEKYT